MYITYLVSATVEGDAVHKLYSKLYLLVVALTAHKFSLKILHRWWSDETWFLWTPFPLHPSIKFEGMSWMLLWGSWEIAQFLTGLMTVHKFSLDLVVVVVVDLQYFLSICYKILYWCFEASEKQNASSYRCDFEEAHPFLQCMLNILCIFIVDIKWVNNGI